LVLFGGALRSIPTPRNAGAATRARSSTPCPNWSCGRRYLKFTEHAVGASTGYRPGRVEIGVTRQ
jgi:hypothetical protein